MTARFALVGAALMVLGGPVALVAQTGMGSGVSGRIVVGSAIAGGAFVPTSTTALFTPIPASTSTAEVRAITAPIPAALVPLVMSLAAGTVSPPALAGSPASAPIPADVGILVLQLAAGTPGSAATGAATTALLVQLGSGAGAPGAEMLTNMLGTLAGVLVSPTPANIAAAVTAFNAAIADASSAYLADAPPALAASLQLLAGLVGPAQ